MVFTLSALSACSLHSERLGWFWLTGLMLLLENIVWPVPWAPPPPPPPPTLVADPNESN